MEGLAEEKVEAGRGESDGDAETQSDDIRYNGAPTRAIGESAEWARMHSLAHQAYHQQNPPQQPALNVDALQPLLNFIVQSPAIRQHAAGARSYFHPRRPPVRASFLRRLVAEIIDSSLITLPVVTFLIGADATEAALFRTDSALMVVTSLTSDLVAMLNVPHPLYCCTKCDSHCRCRASRII